MAYPPSAIPVTNYIGTTNSADDFATSIDTLNRGGWRGVADITALNAITTKRRNFGMVVALQTDNSEYKLCNAAMGGVDNDIANNANWILQGTGGGITIGAPVTGGYDNYNLFKDSYGNLANKTPAGAGIQTVNNQISLHSGAGANAGVYANYFYANATAASYIYSPRISLRGTTYNNYLRVNDGAQTVTLNASGVATVQGSSGSNYVRVNEGINTVTLRGGEAQIYATDSIAMNSSDINSHAITERHYASAILGLYSGGNINLTPYGTTSNSGNLYSHGNYSTFSNTTFTVYGTYIDIKGASLAPPTKNHITLNDITGNVGLSAATTINLHSPNVHVLNDSYGGDIFFGNGGELNNDGFGNVTLNNTGHGQQLAFTGSGSVNLQDSTGYAGGVRIIGGNTFVNKSLQVAMPGSGDTFKSYAGMNLIQGNTITLNAAGNIQSYSQGTTNLKTQYAGKLYNPYNVQVGVDHYLATVGNPAVSSFLADSAGGSQYTKMNGAVNGTYIKNDDAAKAITLNAYGNQIKIYDSNILSATPNNYIRQYSRGSYSKITMKGNIYGGYIQLDDYARNINLSSTNNITLNNALNFNVNAYRTTITGSYVYNNALQNYMQGNLNSISVNQFILRNGYYNAISSNLITRGMYDTAGGKLIDFGSTPGALNLGNPSNTGIITLNSGRVEANILAKNYGTTTTLSTKNYQINIGKAGSGTTTINLPGGVRVAAGQIFIISDVGTISSLNNIKVVPATGDSIITAVILPPSTNDVISVNGIVYKYEAIENVAGVITWKRS